jgi:hypothetical protein
MELDSLRYIPVVRKSGDEPFKRDGKEMQFRLLDFWKWSASDLIGNAQRGILAEYIVASVLGIANTGGESLFRLSWRQTSHYASDVGIATLRSKLGVAKSENIPNRNTIRTSP